MKLRSLRAWLSALPLPLVAFMVAAIDLLGLYVYLGHRFYLLNPVWIYLTIYGILFAFYCYAAGRLLPLIPPAYTRAVVALILVFGVLFRVAVVPAPSSLTTDMYRYAWDGRLTLHGINPYRWAPNDKLLRPLRDSLWERMEYKPYQTIYMPVSQAFFALGNLLFGNNLIGYKAMYALFDCGVMGLLLLLLRLFGRSPTQVIWYAWCPLPSLRFRSPAIRTSSACSFCCWSLFCSLKKRRAIWPP